MSYEYDTGALGVGLEPSLLYTRGWRGRVGMGAAK